MRAILVVTAAAAAAAACAAAACAAATCAAAACAAALAAACATALVEVLAADAEALRQLEAEEEEERVTWQVREL